MKSVNAIEQLVSENNQLAKHAIHVHKFGGSSLASVECIERVVNIIKNHCKINDFVVVSANGKTTDALVNIYQQALDVSSELEASIEALQVAQQLLINTLLKSHSAQLITLLEQDIELLKSWVVNTRTNDKHIEKNEANILALGELWSARLLSAVLSERVCPSYFVDSRDFLVVNNDQDCVVDDSLSQQQFSRLLQGDKLAVVTGFIAKNAAGYNCTLGRNGSDYSATIVASLIGALNVTLWTDVDGIYSADPRIVPLARKLNRLPNGVAKELGRLGNPVLHAKTLQPLENHSTHLHIASSFDPNTSGTEVGRFGQIAKSELSVTYLNDLIIAKSISLTGSYGEQAIKQFSAICSDINAGFIVITQNKQKALSQWLASHDTEVSFTPVSIIAIVGHEVAKHGDVKARFKRALKNYQTMHLVSSTNEHSLIAVLPHVCTGETVNNVHHDMTKDARHIGVVIAGVGNIGERFIEMLPAQMDRIPALENVHLVGLVSSKKAIISRDGIDVTQAYELFQKEATPYKTEDLLSWLANHPYDELIVVDITPSEDFSLLYQEFFEKGIHVIGANKWAASSSTEHYNQLLNIAKKNHCLWLGNTTVGAGLPINFAIDNLLECGDSIKEISGVFSGTLSWLFETYDGDVPFSELLTLALSQGITEPDPREDLSGRDVQRKLLILARLAGFELALEDIDCQNLVPKTLQEISTQEFLDNVVQLDSYFADKLEKANSQNGCIRYVAAFTCDNNKIKAKVSLEILPKTDAFANLTPGDNIFKIISQCYQDNPLIIRGAGAGRDVTSAGLHSDLAIICKRLAHRKQPVKLKGIQQ
jgi:aspartokinase/homoserine dehydrogenase 2